MILVSTCSRRQSAGCRPVEYCGALAIPLNQERLGVFEAKDEDEAVEAAATKFRIPASERHKIIVSKADRSEMGKTP